VPPPPLRIPPTLAGLPGYIVKNEVLFLSSVSNKFPTSVSSPVFKSGLYSLKPGWVYRLDSTAKITGAPIGSPLTALSFVRNVSVSDMDIALRYVGLIPPPGVFFFVT